MVDGLPGGSTTAVKSTKTVSTHPNTQFAFDQALGRLYHHVANERGAGKVYFFTLTGVAERITSHRQTLADLISIDLRSPAFNGPQIPLLLRYTHKYDADIAPLTSYVGKSGSAEITIGNGMVYSCKFYMNADFDRRSHEKAHPFTSVNPVIRLSDTVSGLSSDQLKKLFSELEKYAHLGT